jgi:hypothetical protein
LKWSCLYSGIENGGIYSNDPLLDSNPDELWKYFISYLQQRPNANIYVVGYHIEYSFEADTTHGVNGDRVNVRKKEHRVADFSCTIGLNRYIGAGWSRLYASCGKDGGFRTSLFYFESTDLHVRSVSRSFGRIHAT